MLIVLKLVKSWFCKIIKLLGFIMVWIKDEIEENNVLNMSLVNRIKYKDCFLFWKSIVNNK